MLGNEPDEAELMDCWQCLRIVGEMAFEMLPDEPPKYVPSIALGPEIEMGFALYHMARSEKEDATIVLNNCLCAILLTIIIFVSFVRFFLLAADGVNKKS